MNPWIMGLLAAAVSAIAGAGATSWLSPDIEEGETGVEIVAGELDAPDDGDDGEHAWLERLAAPEIDVLHPLAALEDNELEELVMSSAPVLGSMSIGSPSRGALVNAVQFPESTQWERADPDHAWGTTESIEFTKHAISRVVDAFPDSPVLYVGDFSGPRGGRLKPHKSHQSGRDVDIGYYYQGESVWYRRATAANLDRARTWALVKALITETRVEYIFMDRGIQPLLEEYALAHGEDAEWLSLVFESNGRTRDAIVRHRWGHATHFHVRFENPTAELTARRTYPWLQKAGLLAGGGYYGERWSRPRRRR